MKKVLKLYHKYNDKSKKLCYFRMWLANIGENPRKGKKDMFVANFKKTNDSIIRTALPESVGQGYSLARTYKISELQCIDRGRQL